MRLSRPGLHQKLIIQVFIGSANLYWRVIQGFNKIVAPLTSILKTTGSSEVSNPRALGVGDNKVVGVSGGR